MERRGKSGEVVVVPKFEIALKWTTMMSPVSPPAFQAAVEKRTGRIELSRALLRAFCWPLSHIKL